MKREKTAVLSTRVPVNVAKKIRATARKAGYISVSDYIRNLLRQHIA